MRWTAVALVALVVSAGCVTLPEAADDEPMPDRELVDREVNATGTFEATVSSDAYPERTRIDVNWTDAYPGQVQELSVELTWQQATNAFGLHVDANGTDEEVDPPSQAGSTQVEATFEDLPGGSYAFHPTAEGAVARDELTLTVAATFRVQIPEDAELTMSRSGDGWEARLTYRDEGPVEAPVDVELSTGNGGIGLDDADDPASVVVDAVGRAETQGRALARAASIHVTARVDGSTVDGTARADEWQDRYADVEASVDATVDVTASSGNGDVRLDHADVRSAVASSGNGGISGTVQVADGLEATSGNGAVDLDVTPTDSFRLTADSGNGDIDLGLKEGPDIAYEIEAETGNGRLTESMDEARLDGDDQDATLRTVDGDGRPIQVTGSASSGNGDVAFAGR